MSLHGLAIKRAVLFTMVFAGIFGFGMVSLSRLNPEFMPDVNFPIAGVIANYQGAGPVDIENLITKPIEGAVATVTNVKEISSTIMEGMSITLIEFNWGTNMDVAAADVREKIDLIERLFPTDIEKPMVIKFDPTMMPILIVTISGELNLAELRKIAEDEIKPKLERIEGVASADVLGGLKREIQVNLDGHRMDAYGLSIDRIIGALQSANLSLPGGSIERGSRDYVVRTIGEFKTVKEIEDVAVSYANGTPVYLKDVARVEDTFEEKLSETRVEGKPGVMLRVQKSSGAITVEVSDRVRKELSKIEKDMPLGVTTGIRMDQAEFIHKSIDQIVKVALLGAIFAFLLLLFFLHDIRSSLIVGLSIPGCVIATFVAMDAFGLTLNMLSLGGLALAIGMLVDNAIVVTESAYRHREEGKGMRDSALIGTSEVAMPIAASTLTTVAVFLPVVFVPGIIGMFFKDFSLTVTVSLLVSLFMALTLVPLLCSRFLKVERKGPKRVQKISERIKGWIDGWNQTYHKALEWCLNHKRVVVFGVLGILILSIFLVFPGRFVGTAYMPRQDEGRISITVELPPGSQLETTEEVVKQIEKIVREDVPELKSMHSSIGGGMGGMIGFGGGRSDRGTVRLELVDLDKRKRSQWDIMEVLRPKFAKIPGAEVTFGGMMMGSMVMGMDSPISVEIYGYGMAEAKVLADQVKHLMEEVPGTRDIEVSLEKAMPEFDIRIDRAKASALGLPVAVIANAINSYIRGTVASRYREGGDEYNIRVRLSEEDRQDIQDLYNLPISTPLGKVITLGSITEAEPALGPLNIERKGQERLVTVEADYKGRDLGSITRDIEQGIAKLQLPSDFSIKMGGEAEEQRESFMWLGIALLGAILLIYAVMAAFFESFLDPFVIMFIFPLAIIGVIWMLFFTNTIFSTIAFIGLVMLVGIVVNNGIVMIGYINLLRRREKLGLREAVVLGAGRRLRPILMTALTTIFAMIPMALGLGEGAELLAPMARAVIGGLISATFLTLFVVPVVYTAFEQILLRRRGKRAVSG